MLGWVEVLTNYNCLGCLKGLYSAVTRHLDMIYEIKVHQDHNEHGKDFEKIHWTLSLKLGKGP